MRSAASVRLGLLEASVRGVQSGVSVPAAARRRSETVEAGPRRSPSKAAHRRSRPVVLLVDDLEDQRELYRQYLQFAGYDVIVARDGFEGIDRALMSSPDVVIMDLAMPGLDGFEATQRLKLVESTRGIPVIALTAHVALPREWALSAGCAAYLRKPCYPHDLALAIGNVLEQEEAHRPQGVSPGEAPLRVRVLVVDGSVGDRELFAEYLEYRGCTVSVTLDGAAALGDAQRLRPGVIVLDLDTPRMHGGDVLRALRKDPRTRDIPVIGLSHALDDSARAEARSLGAELLAKPCEPEALYLAVSRGARSGRGPA